MYGNESRMNPPVSEGDEVEVTIESVGEKGDGMAKVDGFVLFVPSTQQGQRVKVKVTRVLQKVGFAQVVGEVSAAPATASTPEAFNPKEELDSEDFGDESPAVVAEEGEPVEKLEEELEEVEAAEPEEKVVEEEPEVVEESETAPESDEEAIDEIEEAADEIEESVEEVTTEAEEALKEEAEEKTPEEVSAADIPAETVADATDESEKTTEESAESEEEKTA